MQVPGIRIAKAKGWKVIVADGNPEAVAGQLGDHFEVVDLKDKEGLLALAGRYAKQTGLDGVFTAGTDFSASVAWVAEKLGLPGVPYAVAMRATDKCLMREAFAKAGLPSPRFTCWTGEGDPGEVSRSGMSFPLVVKPVDNMGSRGVRRVDDTSGLVEACRAALPLSRTSRVIVEEFMEGEELSLDAVVYRGRVTVCGVADRHIYFPPHFVEMGHTMPTELDGDAVREAEEIFADGIRAIGIENGAAKGDIKVTPRGPMIGEIAARLSGGYMSGWTCPLSSGVEVTEGALNIAVGLPPGNLAPRYHRTCAERALLSIPGTVAEVSGLQEARESAGVKEIFLRVAPGAEVVFPSNNVEKCGNVIAVADSRAEAVDAARTGINAIGIRLVPLVDATTHFLFRETANSAFTMIRPDLMSSIDAMPPYRGDPTRAAAGEGLVVEPLGSFDRIEATDWHGMRFADAVRAALLRGGAAIERGGAGRGLALSGLFWRAIVRGSAQGGIYLLDSVREAVRRGRLREFLEGL